MNPIELMKNAEKLSVQQLQQAVESGTLPAYIGVPLIQEKVKQQQQMQTAAAGQQGPQATVKDQIMQQAGVTQLPSGLPEEYADGGIVGFALGGDSRKASKAQEIEAVLGRAAAEAYLQGFAWPEQQMQEKLNPRNTNVPTLSEAMKNSPPAKFAGDVVDFTKQAAGTYGDLYEEGGIPAIAEYQKANIQGVASGIGDKLKSAVSKITPDVEKLYYGPKGKREDFAGLSGTAKMDVAQTIDEAATAYGVDPKALRALAQIESGMNPNAKNPDPNSTASGLFQFTKGTAKDYGISNAFDPRESAFAAARMLRENVDKYGDYTLAASAHNLGRFSKPETLAKNTDYINAFNKAYAAQGGEQPKGIESLATQQQAAPQPQGSDMSGIEQALAASMYSADETDPAKIAAQYKAMIGDDKGIAALRDKIASMEAKQASAEEKAPWLALMQAGLATMAGTSPYAAVNIGQGMQTGLEAYTKSQADAEKGELQRYKLEAELANAQRELDISVATKGIESADARRKFNKVTALQNEQFKYNQRQEDRRIGLQERTTAVAERRQNRYDMIEEQAQRFMAENPNMPSTEAYAKAAQMFPTGGTGGMSDTNRKISYLKGLVQSKVAQMGKVQNTYSAEGKAELDKLKQDIAAYEKQIEDLMRGSGQAPPPVINSQTPGWSVR